MNSTGQGTDREDGGVPERIVLEARPERRLIRPHGGHRHVDFVIGVPERPAGAGPERAPLNLALVLDRSGSMQGDKIATAKSATLAVLDQLQESDRVALVIFDDHIDVLQEAAPATPAVKARLRAALSRVGARASTALHEGWLTGCRAIAGDAGRVRGGGLARCFLLTDGLANVGVTDPEQIASEAAGIRDRAGISTSTFGIGADYDEGLLGPMAVAGGGQFHHLRAVEEITRTFVGELGDLLAVAVRQVRLEIAGDEGVAVDLVSQYWTSPAEGRGTASVAVGDLLSGEERHLVVRFGFPERGGRDECQVRGRLLWQDDRGEHTTAWQALRFSYASDAACTQEPRDPAVMHWVGLHHAARAQREAVERNRRGDLAGAREAARRVRQRLAEYADSDPNLLEAMERLQSLEGQVAAAPLPSMAAKEHYARNLRESRGQKDYREPLA